MRVLNLCVAAVLIFAAVYVYEIKFESTLRAERVASLRAEVRQERETIAALRAEWAQLENPARIEALVRRHLDLEPVEPNQFDSLDSLPVRPPREDAIATMLETVLDAEDRPTGSVLRPEQPPEVRR